MLVGHRLSRDAGWSKLARRKKKIGKFWIFELKFHHRDHCLVRVKRGLKINYTNSEIHIKKILYSE